MNVEGAVKTAVKNFNSAVLEPILWILVAASFILFLWGIFIFLINGNDGDRQKGKNHMLWGVIGIFIVLSAWGFVQLINSTVQTFV